MSTFIFKKYLEDEKQRESAGQHRLRTGQALAGVLPDSLSP